MGLMTFVCTFESSVFSTAIVATSKEFGVSTEVMTLGVSLYVLVRGYALFNKALAMLIFKFRGSHLSQQFGDH
jgi:hypothetical protein